MRRFLLNFAGILSALAVSLPLWVAIAPSATAGSFVGDMLVTNDREPGVILAFDPSTGAYQGIFANLGPDYDAQTLAQGPNGNIYVTSPQGAVFEYNAATGQQVGLFQILAPGPNPSFSGITFDSSGNLYVMEYLGGGLSELNQYDPTTGTYIRTIVDNLSAAVGVTFASGALYVTDSAGIQQFSTNGTLGITISGNYFYQITTGPNGNLYAADGISSVYEFTPSGTQVGSGPFVAGVLGAYGPGFGPDGSLYVADGNTSDGGDSVYKFDANGNMVGSGAFFSNGLLVSDSDVMYDAGPASVPEPGTFALAALAITTAVCRWSWMKVRKALDGHDGGQSATRRHPDGAREQTV